MLVLTRRLGESLIMRDDAKIKLTILSVRGREVRLGVDAPSDIDIYREELTPDELKDPFDKQGDKNDE